jgi:hypothetical protein
MIGLCSTHGGDQKFIQNVGNNSWRKDVTRKTGASRRIILKRILEKWFGRLWIVLIWSRTMKFRVYKSSGISWLPDHAERNSQEGICCMDTVSYVVTRRTHIKALAVTVHLYRCSLLLIKYVYIAKWINQVHMQIEAAHLLLLLAKRHAYYRFIKRTPYLSQFLIRLSW